MNDMNETFHFDLPIASTYEAFPIKIACESKHKIFNSYFVRRKFILFSFRNELKCNRPVNRNVKTYNGCKAMKSNMENGLVV